jgi:hypothetical protein
LFVVVCADLSPTWAINKCGGVGGETWTAGESPYVVTDECGTAGVTVASGTTLTIEAGVEVKFQAGTGLQVSGTLDVNGTASDPVLMTSDAAAPQAGDWEGVTGGSVWIEHATIRFGTYGVYARTTVLSDVTLEENGVGVYVDELGTATLTNVTARLNDDGLTVRSKGGLAAMVDATGCTFTENSGYGVNISRHADDDTAIPSVTITGSSIHSNSGAYDYFVDVYWWANPAAERTVLDATDNWWGTTDPSIIEPRIADHADNSGSPIVDWCGFLDGPGGIAVRTEYCPDLSVCDETVVWDQTDRPYLLVSDMVICPTGTLQVEPGVEVRALAHSNPSRIRSLGQLEVNGTASDPVLMTSDAAAPQAGDWVGVSGNVSIDHATIRFATHGVYAGTAVLSNVILEENTYGVYAHTGTAKLTNVTARLNDCGLYAYSSSTVAGVIEATGCTITENRQCGVIVTRASYGEFAIPSVTITGSSIHSNSGSLDYFVDSFAHADPSYSRILWTTDCWWGTASVDRIRERIYDNEDSGDGRPRVYFRALGESCEFALAGDEDRDAIGDFEDNCPALGDLDQTDTDGDGMGDPCDPDPSASPSGDCDGIDDELEGYLDTDGDGWGDPCDFQPTRDDSYPGAPELCDARDNDGDALLADGELTDEDFDQAIACGDCDDLEPEVYPCACEDCLNARDDDCDTFVDETDTDCGENPYCVVMSGGGDNPILHMEKGSCGGASPLTPCDVLRGTVEQLQFAEGSVDLGQVNCVADDIAWDRVTDLSTDRDPACNAEVAVYYLSKYSTDASYGTASSGEPRNTMDPVCP